VCVEGIRVYLLEVGVVHPVGETLLNDMLQTGVPDGALTSPITTLELPPSGDLRVGLPVGIFVRVDLGAAELAPGELVDRDLGHIIHHVVHPTTPGIIILHAAELLMSPIAASDLPLALDAVLAPLLDSTLLALGHSNL